MVKKSVRQKPFEKSGHLANDRGKKLARGPSEIMLTQKILRSILIFVVLFAVEIDVVLTIVVIIEIIQFINVVNIVSVVLIITITTHITHSP